MVVLSKRVTPLSKKPGFQDNDIKQTFEKKSRLYKF